MESIQYKTCYKCGLSKSVSEFYKTKANKDGLFGDCKACSLERGKKWRKDNPDRVREIRIRKNAAVKNDPVRAAAYRETKRKYSNSHPRGQEKTYKAYAKRRYELKKQFGITLDQYNAMLEAQGRACLICGDVNNDGRTLSVDHCHKSGVIRGLLCRKCNLGIAMFKDSPDLLQKAIQYLS